MGIPEGWRTERLGDLASLVTSGSRGWAQFYSDDGAKFIRITNLQRGTTSLDLSDLVHVALPDGNAEGRRTQLQAGDILISITADLGLIGLVPPNLGEAYVNQHIALVRVGATDIAVPHYLALVLASPPAQVDFQRNNDAGAKAGLNLPAIRRAAVDLPPLGEQRKIAAILSSVDEAIEKTQAVIDQVQVVKKGLMQELLTKGLPGRHEKFKQTEIGEIPESWDVVPAGVACELITKGTTPGAHEMLEVGDIPYLKVYNLAPSGVVDFNYRPTFVSRVVHEGALRRSRVRPGDVLMNIVGPPLGKVALVPATHPEWNINQAIAMFRSGGLLDSRFLHLCLSADHIFDWARTRAKRTSTQLNLTLQICRDVPVPLPPLREQIEIVECIESVRAASETATRHGSGLGSLKSALMSTLLTGELRVTP